MREVVLAALQPPSRSRAASTHLRPVDPVEAAGSGGCGGDGSWLSTKEAPVQAQLCCCPNPGPQGLPGPGPSGPLTIQEAPLGGQFLACRRLGSSTFGLLLRKEQTLEQEGTAQSRPWAPIPTPTPTPPHAPPSPAVAFRCGHGTAPGHCLLGPPQCPAAQLENIAGCQQLATSPRPVLRGRSGSSVPPQPCVPLTGLLELLLVVVQGLVVVHADPAHLDPQLFRHWLLAKGGVTGEDAARALLKHQTKCPLPTALGKGTLAPSPAGESQAQKGAESGLGPRARGGRGGAYSLCRGVALRRLTFCTMVAWLRRAMRMREAASLQGSPSTCTGMALDVLSTTSRHCVSRSPWPPTCSAACGHRRLRSGARAGGGTSSSAPAREQSDPDGKWREGETQTRREVRARPRQRQ